MRDLECQNSENLNVLSNWDRQQTGQEANTGVVLENSSAHLGKVSSVG